MRTLVWFRRDLRIHDHAALAAAASRGAPIVGLYVCSPGDWERHDDAPAKVDLTLRSLAALSGDLGALNIPLLVRTARAPRDVPGAVAEACRDAKASAAFALHEYEIHEAARDRQAEQALRGVGVVLHLFHGQVVLPPEDVRTQAGTPYTVFTPFKKRWIALAQERGVEERPAPARQSPIPGLASEPVPTAASFAMASSVSASLWPAGEREAQRRLRAFVQDRIARYKDDRDVPGVNGTSTLSPYLAVGCVSPRQCVRSAMAANAGRLESTSPGPTAWIGEIIWREFYRHVLVHHPRICMGRAFKPATERVPWLHNDEHLRAWQQGRTGVPIVDAAMRQLLQTGWMHNRLRMIVAMYLSKDLFLDWRLGEGHFMKHLVDGDLASNNGGWQWSASTGTDAAPYFRIYNPVVQSQRFDPDGNFIRSFVPELRALRGDEIHDPSKIPPLVRAALDYPEPIVDRARTRERVLAAFGGL